MELTLRRLSVRDGRDVYEMLQEIGRNENGFQNGAFGLSREGFRLWLLRQDQISRGAALEDWMVPSTTFWLCADGRPVGVGKLRHRLTPALMEAGGNIGYAVRATERGKGYGNALLPLLMDEARRLGLKRAYIDCFAGNEPSRRIIERAGGKPDRVTESRRYYWLEL